MLTNQDGEVLCPVCGDNYVHIEAVTIYPVGGTMLITCDSDGLHSVGPVPPTAECRGAVIGIVHWCENGGHKWEEKRNFHKGTTYLAVHRMKDLVQTKVSNCDDGKDLWRD